MGHHPDLVREMAARHSRGTSRVGRLSACEKLVIRRPKRSWRTGRSTTRLEYQASKGPSVSAPGPFWSLFARGGRMQACSRTNVQVCLFLVNAIHYSACLARPRMRFRSLNRFGRFPKVDVDVHRSSGLKPPALSATLRL